MNLFEYLDKSNIDYSVREHEPVSTAQKVAQVEHEKGRFVAKSVMLKVGGELVMCVVPAPATVVYDKVRQYLGREDVMLAEENDFADVFVECELGAEPPFGNLYDIRTLIDPALAETDHLVFNAGTHDKSIHMKTADYLDLAKPEIVDIAHHKD